MSDPGSNSDDAAANERLARRFYEVLASGDESRIDTVLAPSWEQIPLGEHSSPGVAGYRELIGFLRGAFTDLTITVDDVVAAGDRVAIRTTTRGTHSGAPVMGIPATNRQFAFRASDFHHVEDGRIVRSWHLEDYLALLSQLGATVEAA